jgi:hypothetical protein
MLAILVFGLVPADSPSDISSEIEVVIVGKLGFVDLKQRRLNVHCGGVEEVVDVPEGSRIRVSGVESDRMTIFSRMLTPAGKLDVTIKRMPGGGGKLDIVIHNKLKLMSEEDYIRLVGTPP